MGFVGGAGFSCGGFTSIGIILVLFILLVIVLRGIFI
ncbi:sporulation protein YjcZ [Paenibacillus sp. HJGM_3]